VTTRTCKHGPCGKSFEPSDSRQEFCDSTCRANNHYAAHPEKGRSVQPTPLQSVATHPLVEAREAQEATKLKDHYSQVIYQGIIERLERGPVHADDLEDLFPDSDRTMCRKLVGAQFGSLASRHYIREKERRKSLIASRKGAKSSVWEFTKKGRERLAGVGAGSRGDGQGLVAEHVGEGVVYSPAPASVDSSEASTTTTGKGPAGTHDATLDRPASSQSDSPAGARLLDDGVTGSSTVLHQAVGEPTALPGLEGPPSAYDPYSEAA
jgi:hypothetical protein